MQTLNNCEEQLKNKIDIQRNFETIQKSKTTPRLDSRKSASKAYRDTKQ